MVKAKSTRLTRQDWLLGALEILGTTGVEGIKIVALARLLGVTSGSFYWHFSNRRELHQALCEYWEREMTDVAIAAAKNIEGPPIERIWKLMEQVMDTGMARYDLAIWHWALADETVQTVFKRTIEKRFKFAAWMFGQAGFSKTQAQIRGRMMVIYLMGESTLFPGSSKTRKRHLRMKFDILTSS
jgi:AcrR family transcriptional regulator